MSSTTVFMLAVLLASSPAHAEGPQRATLACAEGLKNFPFLKPWVAKLDNFIAPIEIGSSDGSLFYTIGATTVQKGAAELWKKDTVTLELDWRHMGGGTFKNKGGKIETGWLGDLPAASMAVKPGPGAAPVGRTKAEGARDSSQMGSRRNVGVLPQSPEQLKHAREAVAAVADPPAWTRFWRLLFSQTELDLLTGCDPPSLGHSSCKLKFNDDELKLISGASHQYRLTKYREVLRKRLDEYRTFGRIWAYEGTSKALDWEDLSINPVVPTTLGTHFWLPTARTQYGYDWLDAQPGHHKPVTGLFARQCETKGDISNPFTVCTDIVLYNNHYFDFWARVVYFFPWCDTQVALAYETADVDQVKNSRIARIIFGGEMRKLLGLLLETRLRRLHMLGS